MRDYTPERVAEICGIDQRDPRGGEDVRPAPAAAIVYCLGVAEHSTGTDGVKSLSNLAMLTGNYGKPGCGVNPLRGQNNVQGACDMGAQPNTLPGYQKLSDPAVRAKFERGLGRRASACA